MTKHDDEQQELFDEMLGDCLDRMMEWKDVVKFLKNNEATKEQCENAVERHVQYLINQAEDIARAATRAINKAYK